MTPIERLAEHIRIYCRDHDAEESEGMVAGWLVAVYEAGTKDAGFPTIDFGRLSDAHRH